MGGGLSRQEELFVLGQWPELLESAMGTDNETSKENADGSKHASTTFRMSFYEWQALISLLDSPEPCELPSRLFTNISGRELLNPIVVFMVHACCWVDGSVSEQIFAERITRLQENLQSQEEIPRWGRRTKEEEAEREVVNKALRVFKDILAQRGRVSTQKRGDRVVIADVESLISWDDSKRPVVVLAHAFIVGALACIYPEPCYAEAAIHSFRNLQQAVDEAVSSVWRGKRSMKGAACKITEWQAVRRLETILARRQREVDVADLLAVEDRWWLQSNTMVPHASSKASLEERWEAVSSHYIGQQHVWAALRTHFLSSDVFNAEKPTVIVLFGPSGFGKSELARRLACLIHDVEVDELETSGKLVYIHLPSFCTRDTIYSLVDPPAAHVGEGVLLSALRRNDDAVVVLDEFEKGTADAIQNLWLSAFQKKGTLRSLKDASRSISTEKVTFVLTCNIAADTIQHRTKEYLRATAEEQAAMRKEWTEVCRDACRKTMHEPFVNRVDYFFPFVPYTEEEKRRFIHLQLRRMLLDQRAKDRRIYVTPRMVKAIGSRMQTFHASTIECLVRPLLLEAVQKRWDTAVLTVVELVGGTEFVALPAMDKSDGVTTWNSLPGAKRALEVCELPYGATGALPPVEKGRTDMVPGGNSGGGRGGGGQDGKSNIGSLQTTVDRTAKPTFQDFNVASDARVGIDRKYALRLETAVEKELQVELDRVKELLVMKEKEIAYLKEKVLQLEKLLAFFLATTLMCLLFLSFIVGMKIVFVMGIVIFVGLWLLVEMPLQLLMGAIRVLYGVLGPVGSVIAVLVAFLWGSQTLRNAVVC
ncbi:hypothetical protein MOQ_001921 [Trypanosoma cruzi marinkellei]|uniref:AAA+ ATPase domain-containing protein n=1 Tax=Trypanosoma cruzi marinkellei TaxID=85056 RepID=K2NSA2_TRYCR|nr:hypothetical protein MOQ_001921 [Trypanosoma cruzi marinkellei]